MKTSNTLIFYFLILSFNATPARDIYKWVDDDGKTHYSTHPPENARKKAERQDIPSRQTSAPENVQDAIVGQWRGIKNNAVIELHFFSYGETRFDVVRDSLDFRQKDILDGEYSIHDDLLTIESYGQQEEKTGQASYMVDMKSHSSLQLAAIRKDSVYTFTKEPEQERKLTNPAERKLEGLWVEVNPYNLNEGIRKFRFHKGFFIAYDHESHHDFHEKPNRFSEISRGRWKIADNTLTMTYWSATDGFNRPLLKKKDWKIAEFSAKRFKLEGTRKRARRTFRKVIKNDQ